MAVYHHQDWSNLVKMRCPRCIMEIRRGRGSHKEPIVICSCCGFAWLEHTLKSYGVFKPYACTHDAVDSMKLVMIE